MGGILAQTRAVDKMGNAELRPNRTCSKKLNASDCRSFYEFRLHGLELHPEAFATGAEDWRKATDDQVAGLLNQSRPSDFVLGAYKDEKLIGDVGVKHEPKSAVSHKAAVWGFFVHPDHRGSGLRQALLSELLTGVRQEGEVE